MFQTEELFSLKGRTAVITGGLTGLGFAITKCMVGAGAKAVVLSREKQERAEEILAEFEGRAVFYQFDITDVDRAQAMADRIITVKSGTVADMVLNREIVDVADIEW